MTKTALIIIITYRECDKDVTKTATVGSRYHGAAMSVFSIQINVTKSRLEVKNSLAPFYEMSIVIVYAGNLTKMAAVLQRSISPKFYQRNQTYTLGVNRMSCEEQRTQEASSRSREPTLPYFIIIIMMRRRRIIKENREDE